MSELAVAFRTQRIDEFNTQITGACGASIPSSHLLSADHHDSRARAGTAAAPHYPYTVLRAPPEKGMDPRLQVESIIPHASSNIPLRRVVPASSILSKVVSKHGPDNASLNKSSGVSSDEDSDDDLYPPTGARHVAGHLNRDVMLASGAILSESSVRQRKQSIPDLHLFDRGADYTICPPAYISAPRPSTAASQPLESPAVDSSHDFTENSPQQPPQEPALATERCEVEPSKGHGTSARDVRTPSPTRQHEEPFTPIRSLDDVVDGRQSSARPSTLSSLAACFSDYHDDAVLTSSEMDNHESFEEEEKKCESQRAEPAVTRRGSLHSGDGLVGRKARARRGSNAPDDKKDEMTSSKFLTTKVITPGQGGTPADKWMDGGNYIPQPEFTKRPRTPSLLPRRASTDKRPVTADPSLIVCPSPVPEFTSTGPIGVVIDVPPPAHSESPAPVAEHRRRSAFSSTPDRTLRVVPAISPSPLLLSRDPNRAMLEAATSHRIFSSAAVKSKAEKMFETLLSDLKLEGEGDAAPLSSSRGGRSARHSLDGSLLTPLTNAPPLRPITSDGRHHFSGNLDESPIPLVAPAPTRYIRHSLSGNLASKPVQHHHKQTRPQQQPHLARSIHAVDRHSDDAPTMLFQRPYALSAVASTTVLPTVYQ